VEHVTDVSVGDLYFCGQTRALSSLDDGRPRFTCGLDCASALTALGHRFQYSLSSTPDDMNWQLDAVPHARLGAGARDRVASHRGEARTSSTRFQRVLSRLGSPMSFVVGIVV